MMTLTVNGKREELAQAMALVAYMESRQVKQKMVAVGINREVVHRDRWAEVVLQEGDVVDIVQMVGGG